MKVQIEFMGIDQEKIERILKARPVIIKNTQKTGLNKKINEVEVAAKRLIEQSKMLETTLDALNKRANKTMEKIKD